MRFGNVRTGLWRRQEAAHRLLLLVFGLLLTASAALAQQERRVALIVGVGAYRNVPALANPPNDARDLGAVFDRLGFETETLVDPDRLALEAGVRRLGQRARGADAAFFFFAGHGLEASGRNWLLPAPAEIRSDRDLRFEALDLDSVLEQLDGAARLSILVLDACRDNPFRKRLQASGRGAPATSGLGQASATVGTLLAFATAPDTVADDGRGRNSPFTTALLKRIETPGLEIRQLMAEVRREVREATQGRQVPWENSALEGSFYFRAAAAPAPAAAAPPAVATAPGAEMVFWESVRSSRNPADLRAYLTRFPNGVFASLARNRLEEMERNRSPDLRRPDANSATALDPATPEGREALLLSVLSLDHPVPRGRLEAQGRALQAYQESKQHRAIAASPKQQRSFRVADSPSAAAAEELALERCQLRNDEPCVLFAVNEVFRRPQQGGEWPRRAMERLRHEAPIAPTRCRRSRGSDARKRTLPAMAGHASRRRWRYTRSAASSSRLGRPALSRLRPRP